MNQQINSVKLLDAVTATGAGEAMRGFGSKRTFHAYGVTGSGSGAATIKVQVSNKETPSSDNDWLDLGTISLTLSSTQSGDGFAVDAPWRLVRGNVTALTGTGATVTLWEGA